MSSVAVSFFRAAIRSPLRSKRAITSPVRARSKASGLTRIRVRLTAWAPLFLFAGRRLFRRGAAGGSLFPGARRFRFRRFRRFGARAAARLGPGFLELSIAFPLALLLGAAAAATP